VVEEKIGKEAKKLRSLSPLIKPGLLVRIEEKKFLEKFVPPEN
jgi:hypothetical protein